MRKKQNLASALGVTMHFSEITKLQFGRKRHTLLFILLLLRIIDPQLIISKKYVVTPILFLDFSSPC